MISIVIPVYNIDVVSLINELNQQLTAANIIGEIIVFDDDSFINYKQQNKTIATLPNVTYKELDRNYGRMTIRSLLAETAQYNWLLFIDSDSGIVHAGFLKRYIDAFSSEDDVYSGGTIYQQQSVECNKRLHWKYGKEREAVKGNKNAFHTNNFCIKKEVFQSLKFPEFLKQYGHEDTWMGIELERMGKKICRINNPVEHLNIEDTKIFLKKTDQALENLLLLQKTTSSKILSKHVALFRLFTYIKKARLDLFVNFMYHSFQKKILQNLHSCNPKLFVFDFHRLHQLIQISRRKIND